jgi:UDP-GlcNAc:undecaprenyl-phosphate/decaprenyl-phosphate GlcNAc-1-phosphate transferase
MGEVLIFFNNTLVCESLLILLAVFCTGYITSALLTPAIIKHAPLLGLLDTPNARSIHQCSMPRAGGIAIFFAFHIATLVLILSPIRRFGALDLWSWWVTFLLASSIVFIVGLIDDLRRLSALWKLCGQALAALIVFLSDIQIETILGYHLPNELQLIATIIWFVIITNAFNLIDGIDGLASGITALAALGLAGSLVFRGIYVEAVILCGLIGALLAFLKFNKNPAKIFLGDSGSNLCGFALAYFMLTTGSKHLAFSQQWIVLLVMTVPLLDTALAIWRRSLGFLLSKTNRDTKCNGIMTGDLEHIHHRLLKKGFTSRNVTLVLYLCSSLFILVSLISLPFPRYTLPLLGFMGFLAGLVLYYFGPNKELKESTLLIYQVAKQIRINLIARISRIITNCF